METDYFDGYTGIRAGEGQLFNDILLISIILLSALFSMVFRHFYPLFIKMGKDLFSLKERQSIFDTYIKKNVFFNSFMHFQATFLMTVIGFLVYSQFTGRYNSNLQSAFALFTLIFIIIALYFSIQRLMHLIYGHIFSEKHEYKLWSKNYDTIFYIWEIILYVPALWLIFDNKHATAASILFLTAYILFRIAVIYITIRIFYNRNAGFLYLSAYLCAQEIIPLLFLYEGLKYLHNIIQTSTL